MGSTWCMCVQGRLGGRRECGWVQNAGWWGYLLYTGCRLGAEVQKGPLADPECTFCEWSSELETLLRVPEPPFLNGLVGAEHMDDDGAQGSCGPRGRRKTDTLRSIWLLTRT